jgi:hypothetical protein
MSIYANTYHGVSTGTGNDKVQRQLLRRLNASLSEPAKPCWVSSCRIREESAGGVRAGQLEGGNRACLDELPLFWIKNHSAR